MQKKYYWPRNKLLKSVSFKKAVEFAQNLPSTLGQCAGIEISTAFLKETDFFKNPQFLPNLYVIW